MNATPTQLLKAKIWGSVLLLCIPLSSHQPLISLSCLIIHPHYTPLSSQKLKSYFSLLLFHRAQGAKEQVKISSITITLPSFPSCPAALPTIGPSAPTSHHQHPTQPVLTLSPDIGIVLSWSLHPTSIHKDDTCGQDLSI